jgi:flavin-dependent dehydrogenase
LGLLAAQVLARAGARVRAVGKHDDKLAILRRRGIDTVRHRAGPCRADIVVEATGSHRLRARRRRHAPARHAGPQSTIAEHAPLDLARW